MKLIFKFLITFFILILLFLNSVSFATNLNSSPIVESTANNYPKINTTHSDLYITDSKYEISDIINGNVFAKVDILNLIPSGEIKGNLFVIADTVNINSDTIYLEETNEFGNPIIDINNYSSISRKRLYIC